MSISDLSSSKLIEELTKTIVEVEFTGEEVYGYPVWFPGESTYGIVPVESKIFVQEAFQPFSVTLNKKFISPHTFPFYADNKYADHFSELISACQNEIDRNIRLRINKWEILDYLGELHLKLTQIINNYILSNQKLQIREDEIYINRNIKVEYDQQHNWLLAKYVDFVLTQYWLIQMNSLKPLVDTLKARIEIIQVTDDYVREIERIESSSLQWTKTDTDLLELIISLYDTGSIQNITKSLTQKEAFSIIAAFFGKEIKDIHKKLNAARNRKKENGTFLNKLSLSLEEYYQRLDDKI